MLTLGVLGQGIVTRDLKVKGQRSRLRVQISLTVQWTLQLSSLVMELTCILSHLPGENAAMQHTKATALYHSQHSFPVPPGTHYCWVTRGGVTYTQNQDIVHL